MLPSKQLFSALVDVFSVMQIGLVFSTIGSVSYSTELLLSKHTHLEEPDPTMYTRQFEMLFDTLFAPVGWTVAKRTQSPLKRRVSFQLSIGVIVIFSSLVIYLVTAGIITGAALATHQAFGFVMDPIPLFRQIVAFVVVCGLAVMFHAGD